MPKLRASGSVFLSAALCLVLTGCAAGPPLPPARLPGKSAAVQPLPTIIALPSPRLAPAPPPANPLPPRPADSSPPTSRVTRSAQVAEKLDSAFLVESLAPDSLLVSKKTTAARTPSLFEQSILLGKIRSTLTSANPRSAPLAASASLQKGIATFPIAPSTPPGAAAVAIAKILALDGVHSVRADFPPAAQ